MEALSVCAAVVCRDGKLLLATRRPGGSLAGKWEFPGGKAAAGETAAQCIARELREELGLEVTPRQTLWTVRHDYPDKRVDLQFVLCALPAEAVPVPQEGQQCGWFGPGEVGTLDLAPADERMLAEHLPELARLCGESAARRRTPLPPWLKTSFDGGRERMSMGRLLRGAKLHTVCESARCPNRCECWKHRTATFMILGDTCTRACRFCSVRHGRPSAPDADEAAQVAESVAQLGLKYAVVTCVTRDDLPDGGAGAMAAVVEAIRARNPETLVEVLVSDYNNDRAAIQRVLDASPAVFGHNIETVERLTPSVRSVAQYRRSLEVLSYAAAHRRPGTVIKSGFMMGLGETDEEVRQTLRDLRAAGVEIVTAGQYLQPTSRQLPVERFVQPVEFEELTQYAEKELGFAKAVCGPLVRSSYHAAMAYQSGLKNP